MNIAVFGVGLVPFFVQLSFTQAEMRSSNTVDKKSLLFQTKVKAQATPSDFPSAFLGAIGVQIEQP